MQAVHGIQPLRGDAANTQNETSGWLAGFTHQPNRSSRLSTAELVAELNSLETEFPGVEFDLHNHTISVTTDTIDLEDVYLGPFRIELSLNPNIDGLGYAVTAIDPQPSTHDEEVTHPHVREGGLCEGEGTVPIRKALADGRIGDFFQIVQQILLTYNAGSAFVPLSDWHGIACTACGASTADDERTRCHSTSEPICLDCAVTCADCGTTLPPIARIAVRSPSGISVTTAYPRKLAMPANNRTIFPKSRRKSLNQKRDLADANWLQMPSDRPHRSSNDDEVRPVLRFTPLRLEQVVVSAGSRRYRSRGLRYQLDW